MNKVTQPRRLFVSGASQLSSNAASLWRELGLVLAAESGLILITGGLKGLSDDLEAKTADRMIIEGFLEGLAERRIEPFDRIETMLPDPKLDKNDFLRFEIGRVQVLTNRSAQARRFRMVYSSDVVIAIEGGKGTRSVLDVALAIERPALPLPFGGGVSEDIWKEEKAGICAAFQLTPEEVLQFEQMRLAKLGKAEIPALATQVCRCLLRGFTARCFVIMPFREEFDPVYENAILPALAAYRFTAFRTDRDMVSGNVVETIRDGLKHCYFAIADITGGSPNVMYELGIAHAHQKPVILLCRVNASNEVPSTPFDLSTESVVFYGDNLDDLRTRLEARISVLSGKKVLAQTSSQ